MLDSRAAIVVVESDDGETARLISKYRPPGPVLVVTTRDHVARITNTYFAQYPHKVDSIDGGIDTYKAHAVKLGLCAADGAVVFVKADNSIAVL